MMLRGEKPLAVFVDAYETFPDSVLRYLRLFDRRVAQGRLIKREYVVPSLDRPGVRGWHTILYALPDQEWRIDAMIALRLSGGWSLAKEREEGHLLGYEDWQTEAWIGRFNSSE